MGDSILNSVLIGKIQVPLSTESWRRTNTYVDACSPLVWTSCIWTETSCMFCSVNNINFRFFRSMSHCRWGIYHEEIYSRDSLHYKLKIAQEVDLRITQHNKPGTLSVPLDCVNYFMSLLQKNQMFGFKIYTLSSKLVTEMNSSSDSDVFINIEVMLKDIQAFKNAMCICIWLSVCKLASSVMLWLIPERQTFKTKDNLQ